MSVTDKDATLACRRLGLIDLMGIVLASGVGFWLWQVSDWSVVRAPGLRRDVFERRFDWMELVAVELLALAGLVVVRSWILPQNRRNQVGFLLCTGACVAFLLGIARQAIEVWGGFLTVRPLPFDVTQAHRAPLAVLARFCVDASRASGAVAVGVVVAGLVAGRLGAWRRSTDAMDRLGRWVALGLVLWFLGDCMFKTLQQIRIYQGDFEAW